MDESNHSWFGSVNYEFLQKEILELKQEKLSLEEDLRSLKVSSKVSTLELKRENSDLLLQIEELRLDLDHRNTLLLKAKQIIDQLKIQLNGSEGFTSRNYGLDYTPSKDYHRFEDDRHNSLEVERHLSALEQQSNDLQKNLWSKDAVVRIQENKLADLQNYLDEEKLRLVSTTKQNEELRSIEQGLREQLEILRKEAADAKSNADICSLEIIGYRQQLEEAKAKGDLLEEAIKKIAAEIETERMKGRESEARLERDCDNKLESLRQQYHQAMSEAAALHKAAIADLRSEHAREVASILERAEVEHAAAWRDLGATHQDLHEKIEGYRAEIQSLCRRNHQLHLDNSALRDSEATVAQQAELLKAREAELQRNETDRSQLSENLVEALSEISTLEGRIGDFKRETESLREQMRDAAAKGREEAEALGRTVSGLREDLRDQSSQVLEERERAKALHTELEEAKLKLARSSSLCEQLNQSLSAERLEREEREKQFEMRGVDSQEKLGLLQRDVGDLRVQLARTTAQMEQFRDGLEAARENILDKERLIASLRGDLLSRDQELVELKAAGSAYIPSLQGKQDIIDTLSAQISQLQSQHSSVCSALESLKKKNQELIEQMSRSDISLSVERDRSETLTKEYSEKSSEMAVSRNELYRVCLLLMTSVEEWSGHLASLVDDFSDEADSVEGEAILTPISHLRMGRKLSSGILKGVSKGFGVPSMTPSKTRFSANDSMSYRVHGDRNSQTSLVDEQTSTETFMLDLLPKSLVQIERIRFALIRLRRLRQDFESRIHSVQVAYQDKVDQLQGKVMVMSQQLVASSARLDELKEVLDRDRKRRDADLHEIISGRDAIIEEKTIKVLQANDEIVALKESVETQQRLLNSSLKECSALKDHISDLKQSLAKYEDQQEVARATEETVSSIAPRIVRLSDAYNGSIVEVQRLQQIIENLERERESFAVTVDTLQSQLRLRDESVSKLEHKLHELESRQIPSDLLQSVRKAQQLLTTSDASQYQGVGLERRPSAQLFSEATVRRDGTHSLDTLNNSELKSAGELNEIRKSHESAISNLEGADRSYSYYRSLRSGFADIRERAQREGKDGYEGSSTTFRGSTEKEYDTSQYSFPSQRGLFRLDEALPVELDSSSSFQRIVSSRAARKYPSHHDSPDFGTEISLIGSTYPSPSFSPSQRYIYNLSSNDVNLKSRPIASHSTPPPLQSRSILADYSKSSTNPVSISFDRSAGAHNSPPASKGMIMPNDRNFAKSSADLRQIVLSLDKFESLVTHT